ncbi:MAG: hypothetical protein AAFQ10_16140 [Pseudomonadota bacterium]
MTSPVIDLDNSSPSQIALFVLEGRDRSASITVTDDVLLRRRRCSL